jgi:hypothetical protein
VLPPGSGVVVGVVVDVVVLVDDGLGVVVEVSVVVVEVSSGI